MPCYSIRLLLDNPCDRFAWTCETKCAPWARPAWNSQWLVPVRISWTGFGKTASKMDKLPLVVETEIIIRSLEHKILKARSRILGGRHGDFILIEEPVVSLGDRIEAHFEGDFVCTFLHEGDIYRFESRIRDLLGGNLAFIEYPQQFEVEQLRRHHRISVNIDCRLQLDGVRGMVTGTIQDISEGGCFLSVVQLIPVALNTLATAEFLLPDNQTIEGIQAKVKSVKHHRLQKATEIGLQFLAPPAALSKIRSFCQYCLFFKV